MNEGINICNTGPTALAQRKEGFADVARWISLDSDSETSIYRKFDELGAQNLLYLQAELLVLEKQLNELDKEDVKTDELDPKDAARTWEILTQRHTAGLEDAKVRIELIGKIRAKLREYRASTVSQRLFRARTDPYFRRSPPATERDIEAEAPQEARARRLQAMVQETVPCTRRSGQDVPGYPRGSRRSQYDRDGLPVSLSETSLANPS